MNLLAKKVHIQGMTPLLADKVRKQSSQTIKTTIIAT